MKNKTDLFIYEIKPKICKKHNNKYKIKVQTLQKLLPKQIKLLNENIQLQINKESENQLTLDQSVIEKKSMKDFYSKTKKIYSLSSLVINGQFKYFPILNFISDIQFVKLKKLVIYEEQFLSLESLQKINLQSLQVLNCCISSDQGIKDIRKVYLPNLKELIIFFVRVVEIGYFNEIMGSKLRNICINYQIQRQQEKINRFHIRKQNFQLQMMMKEFVKFQPKKLINEFQIEQETNGKQSFRFGDNIQFFLPLVYGERFDFIQLQEQQDSEFGDNQQYFF